MRKCGQKCLNNPLTKQINWPIKT